MNVTKLSWAVLPLIMCAGCNGSESTQLVCSVDYHFRNPSLGPVNGKQDVKIEFQDRRLISAVDLHTQHVIDPTKIHGYELLVRAFNHDTKGLKVIYDCQDLPITIRRSIGSKKTGGSFMITLDNYHCQ